MSLQRGMNFNLGGNHSVILMSLRPNAPYEDELLEGGTILIYEGHDEPRSRNIPEPKRVDQPQRTSSGAMTQNGFFHKAAQEFSKGLRPPERVRVYEKIRSGIWSYNGIFHIVNSFLKKIKGRKVFKFRLVAVEGEEDLNSPVQADAIRRRVIPIHIKIQVWKRDGGKCVLCGATDELHFDHDVPFSKGGTSLVAKNVQLLCARHNLKKHDRIQ